MTRNSLNLVMYFTTVTGDKYHIKDKAEVTATDENASGRIENRLGGNRPHLANVTSGTMTIC